jgi:hypothetical protein
MSEYQWWKVCCVCGDRVRDRGYIYHFRLDAYVCGTCPLTDVYGEDISMHTIKFYFPPSEIDDTIKERGEVD